MYGRLELQPEKRSLCPPFGSVRRVLPGACSCCAVTFSCLELTMRDLNNSRSTFLVFCFLHVRWPTSPWASRSAARWPGELRGWSAMPQKAKVALLAKVKASVTWVLGYALREITFNRVWSEGRRPLHAFLRKPLRCYKGTVARIFFCVIPKVKGVARLPQRAAG